MKPKDKMWGTWHIISPFFEKVGGGACPVSLT